ncbi:MAG: nitroreductase family protein [Mariprofundaceae bacterium]|nr:nitroreductase family protein [Mariprofundaceae bacterium]
MTQANFTSQERDTVYRVIHGRRDMRHFSEGEVSPAVLSRILEAAHAAPSVGYSSHGVLCGLPHMRCVRL